MWVQTLYWEDPLEEGMATQIQYSHLENPMDRGAWQATVHRVEQKQTQLSDLAHTESWERLATSCTLLLELQRTFSKLKAP